MEFFFFFYGAGGWSGGYVVELLFLNMKLTTKMMFSGFLQLAKYLYFPPYSTFIYLTPGLRHVTRALGLK